MDSGGAHRVVIVGGGAGGLELATALGDRLGRKGRAQVTLVDRSRTHLWKPLLHQVAAGSMDLDEHELEYLAQARWHHFHFRLGAMEGLDRQAREIIVAPTFDEDGEEVVPRRRIPYDTLVIAVGSVSNDFGTPGAARNAIALDTPPDAARFHRRLINACIRAHVRGGVPAEGELDVILVGAGATGVELAAELRHTTRQLAAFGLDAVDPDKHFRISIVEAGPRVLPALPERLSGAAAELLGGLGVKLYLGQRVTEVLPEGVRLADGSFVPGRLTVWAAGIKGPDFLKDLGGLETNRGNQLVVRPTLQTSRDDAIFALGDCAACDWPGTGHTVPPRAQAAHQQASLLLKSIRARIDGRPLPEFRYRDFGSLVSLGDYSTVGSLMGGLMKGSMMIEGWFASLMYVSLYRMHLYALHGFARTALDTLARLITHRTEPRVKLH